MTPHDEFYVGYIDRAPRGLASFTRNVVVGLGVTALGAIGLFALLQNPMRDGLFEFGVERSFEGVLFEEPLALLRPVAAAEDPLLLVGAGKHGLPEFARGNHGRRVRFDGTLIRHDGVTMVEMNDPASFEVLGDIPARGAEGVEVLGRVALEGELVDTKCYLGVMRPATGKVHRACAARCLKGGVPPGILVRRADGSGDRVLLLAGASDGVDTGVDPEWAGRRIAARGLLELRDGLPVLRVEEVALAEARQR